MAEIPRVVPRVINLDDDGRRRLEAGVNKLADGVRVTLGPKSRRLVLDKPFGDPINTYELVTSGQHFELDDPLENLGAQLLKAVGTRTNEAAGAGAVTAAVLAQAMVREGFRIVAAGANPVAVTRGMDLAVDAAVGSVMEQALGILNKQQAVQVAAGSAGDHLIGDVVAEAIYRVGHDGVVSVEESGTDVGLELDFAPGIKLDGGYLSPYFVTDPERMECVLEHPYILIADSKISALHNLAGLLESVVETGLPLLVIANGVEGEALATLVVNKIRGTLKSCAVKLRPFGDRREALEDAAVVTGTQLVAEGDGLRMENATLDQLGHARKVIVTMDSTTIIGGAGADTDLSARLAQVMTETGGTGADSSRDRTRQRRLVAFSEGVAVVKVGAATAVEMQVQKQRVQDAISATQAAIKEGVVAGGGTALVRSKAAVRALAATLSGDEAAGANVVADALGEPLRWIAINAGLEGDAQVERVERESGTIGLNATTGRYEDLMVAGIVDPVIVTRSALQNAASITAMLLASDELVGTASDELVGTANLRGQPVMGDLLDDFDFDFDFGVPVEPADSGKREPGEPRPLYWVSDFPRDEKALLHRRLYAGDTYRLVTDFTVDPPQPGAAAQVTPIGHDYVDRKVQFEVVAEGALLRRTVDGAEHDAPFVERVQSDPMVCEADGTKPFEVEVLAERAGQARIEVHVSVEGVPLDNAHLLEFAVIDLAAPQPAAPPQVVGTVSRLTSLGPRSSAEEPVVHLKTTGLRLDSLSRVCITWARYDNDDLDFVTVEAERDLGVALQKARRDLDKLAHTYGALGPSVADPLDLAQPDNAYLTAAQIGYRLHRALFGKPHDNNAPDRTKETAEGIARIGRRGSLVEVGRRMLIEAPGAPFPWGLVYDGGYLDNAAEPASPADVDPLGFWGYRFTIDRMVRRYTKQPHSPALDDPDILACTVVNTTIPPSILDPHGHLTVAPEDLSRRDPITTAAAFRAWLQQASGVATDVVYFYCHAEPAQNISDLGFFVNQMSSTQAKLILDKSTTGVVTMADLEDGRPPAGSPVVFLTACSAGQGDISFASPFSTVFIRSWDGRSLVASDAEVPAIFGHAFSARVLAEFLGGPKPIGRCLADESRRLLDNRNPFGLFFGLHGRPEVFRNRQP